MRALMPCNLLWLNADKGQRVKSCGVAAKHFPQAGQISLRIDMPTFHIFHPWPVGDINFV